MGHCNCRGPTLNFSLQTVRPLQGFSLQHSPGEKLMRTKAILVCLFLIISAIGVRATTYKTIYSFSSWDDGENPYPGVIFDQAGNLYGVVAWGEESQGTVDRKSTRLNS